MRKITLLFCALLLVPTLALARGDMVSISELRQQVEAMGQWTQTYEAYGRTIEVDVPIIVPEPEMELCWRKSEKTDGAQYMQNQIYFQKKA